MPERIFTMLFLCTGISARSILAEATFRAKVCEIGQAEGASRPLSDVA